MRKMVLAMASLLLLAGGTTHKPAEATAENVPFQVAKNYFFKNNQTLPASPKITTAAVCRVGQVRPLVRRH